jgi:hypothetical protein
MTKTNISLSLAQWASIDVQPDALPPHMSKHVDIAGAFSKYTRRQLENGIRDHSTDQSGTQSIAHCEARTENHHTVQLSDSSLSWKVSNASEYHGSWVGRELSEYRAHLSILDDPHWAPDEIGSDDSRKAVYHWYAASLDRVCPDGTAIVMMSRQHMDDLAGRLMLQGSEWTMTTLPKFSTSDQDALGRKLGEPLWPEWNNVVFLDQICAELGEASWKTFYQQDPDV